MNSLLSKNFLTFQENAILWIFGLDPYKMVHIAILSWNTEAVSQQSVDCVAIGMFYG